MKILVGSENPTKVQAVQAAFAHYFEEIEVIARPVESQVSRQPVNEATFEGAENRAAELCRINREQDLGASYCVGIEAGIIRLYSTWFAFSVICVMDQEGRMGLGTPPMYQLPDRMAQELLAGVELGEVMDRAMGQENTKQKGGAVAFFTRGLMDRKTIYTLGVTLALVPFINQELYFRDRK